MAEYNTKKLNNQALPSFLNSREGWGKLLEIKRSQFPHVHQIEPTNACPYNCIMCPRGEKMTRKIGFMEMGVFCKVIDEISTFPDEVKNKELEIFHFGESLLHPQIDEMVAYANKKGLNSVLSVNAPDLKPELSEKLINTDTYKIIVSIDGFDEHSFEQIRGKKIDYDQAITNIVEAANHIKASGSKTKLVVRMISMSINSHKVKEFEDFWKEKQIDVEIREFFPWGEEEMKDLGEYEKYPPFMPCPFAWQYVVVQWNGDVVVCCRDYNAENIMGNIKDSSLEEIWNNESYRKFRENMISGEFENNNCEPCLNLYYTEE